jgi:IS4 transposase
VILTDATVVRLHELLADVYPACRTNHTKAALKAHAVMSVRGAGRQSIKITSERVHDGPVFKVGPWVKGHLLLFDLGYFKYGLFARIGEQGGYFISRLKQSANPKVVETNRRHRGRAVSVEGEKLRDVIGKMQREVVDVMAEFSFKRRVYAGVRRGDRQVLRVVGIRDEQTGEYHLYVTNIPVEKLTAEDIRSTYALRWEIELLFKELKSHYRLEDLPSRKQVVVESLLYAAILTLVVSRKLLHYVKRKLGEQGERVPTQRWAAVVASVAQELLMLVTRPPREVNWLEKHVTTTLLHEAVDPNVGRPGRLARVENGTHRYTAQSPVTLATA